MNISRSACRASRFPGRGEVEGREGGLPVRATLPAVTGEAAAWDPADPGPFAALAGDRYLGADGDLAVIRTRSGCVMHAHPGWVVVRPDGSGGGEAVFAAPGIAVVEEG